MHRGGCHPCRRSFSRLSARMAQRMAFSRLLKLTAPNRRVIGGGVSGHALKTYVLNVQEKLISPAAYPQMYVVGQEKPGHLASPDPPARDYG